MFKEGVDVQEEERRGLFDSQALVNRSTPIGELGGERGLWVGRVI